jgi:hypothetical protein
MCESVRFLSYYLNTGISHIFLNIITNIIIMLKTIITSFIIIIRSSTALISMTQSKIWIWLLYSLTPNSLDWFYFCLLGSGNYLSGIRAPFTLLNLLVHGNRQISKRTLPIRILARWKTKLPQRWYVRTMLANWPNIRMRRKFEIIRQSLQSTRQPSGCETS